MEKEWERLSHILKTGVAAVLFLSMLIGGAAAVLAVAATALNSFSNSDAVPVTSAVGQSNAGSGSTGSGSTGSGITATEPSQTGSFSQTPSTSQNSSGTAGQGTAQNAGVASQTAPQTVLQTPVVDALDADGVTVGNQIQTAFGNILANALEVLFVERPVPVHQTGSSQSPSGSPSGPSSQSSSQTPANSGWANP